MAYPIWQHGKGKEIFPNGDCYEGTFTMGKKEGKGRFTMSDGGFYDGMVKNNQFQGLGTYCWPD